MDRIISLRRLIADAIEDQLSLNAALPRTLILLVTRPGRLTAEYVSGRMARYVPPFRLYLITSFVFFLVFGLAGSAGNVRFTDNVDLDAPIAESARAAGEEIRIPDLPVLSAAMNERVQARASRILEMTPTQLNQALRRAVLAWAPVVVFMLLPFLAGILKLLYVRSGRFYVEHFILALHLQTFGLIVLAVAQLAPLPALEALLMVSIPVYALLAMKHVYAQSAGKTLLKAGIAAAAYFVGFGISMVTLIILAVATMPV